jgi:hypothetical protein
LANEVQAICRLAKSALNAEEISGKGCEIRQQLLPKVLVERSAEMHSGCQVGEGTLAFLGCGAASMIGREVRLRRHSAGLAARCHSLSLGALGYDSTEIGTDRQSAGVGIGKSLVGSEDKNTYS